MTKMIDGRQEEAVIFKVLLWFVQLILLGRLLAIILFLISNCQFPKLPLYGSILATMEFFCKLFDKCITSTFSNNYLELNFSWSMPLHIIYNNSYIAKTQIKNE